MKNNTNKFRLLNQIEIKILKDSPLMINNDVITSLSKQGYTLYVSFNLHEFENIYPKIFILNEKLSSFMNHLIEKDKIIASGIYFGFIKKSKFYLSLEGAEFLYQNRIFDESSKMQVNEKGEKSILYGNRIRKSMLKDNIGYTNKKGLVLVFNDKYEIIALAKLLGKDPSGIKDKEDEIVAFNLIDKGYYIRMEDKK